MIIDTFNSVINTFDDLCSVVKDFSSTTYDLAGKFLFGGKIKYLSIEKQTKDLTAIFPNIVDRSLNLRTAERINKVVEIKNANLLRLLLTSMGVQRLSNDSKSVLRKFHRNFDNTDFTDFQLSECGIENPEINMLESNFDINNFKNNKFINEVSLNDRFYTCVNGDINEFRFNEASKKDDDKQKNSDNFARGSKIVKTNDSAKLTDNDVRTMNSLSPTMIEIGVPTQTENSDIAILGMIFGVKSKIYPSTSDDIIDVISKNMSSQLFKFIQMSSGEIKFFRDFIFNIDHIKNTVAINNDKTSSDLDKLWKVLKKRGRNQSKRILKINSMDNASIASLTISLTTVEELNTQKGIDLMNPKIAEKFMNLNNLLNLFIVDEVSEIIYIMSDSGDGIFTEMTFDFIDKELSYIGNKKTLNKNISLFG